MTHELKWQKLPALDTPSHSGCLNCPSKPIRVEMNMVIAVGFGDAHAERDGEEVYREPGAYYGQKRCEACGFGRVGKNAEGKDVLCGQCGGTGMVDDPDEAGEPEYWQVSDVEKLAAIDPDHDWRVVLHGPLHGETYQRHGPDEWNLVEKNQGFA